jgi:hypothetical protein
LDGFINVDLPKSGVEEAQKKYKICLKLRRRKRTISDKEVKPNPKKIKITI